MKRTRQRSLTKDPRKNTKLWWIVKHTAYGGALNYRKVPRPFDSRKLTHAVFSGNVGKSLGFTRSKESIQKLIERVAAKYEVRIKDLAVNHDHLHILFYTKSSEAQTRFLRLVAAEMGRKYQALKRKFGIRAAGSLWRLRPFTRLVSWGKKSLQIVQEYIKKNRDEAAGLAEYQPRKHQLTLFLQKWMNGNFVPP